ncbi:MAG TPA: hypothetical protein ENK57_04265 [Polyangiaceae bacterium]|nr:hypothetical protein [Polyangiaceae bacterium]
MGVASLLSDGGEHRVHHDRLRGTRRDGGGCRRRAQKPARPSPPDRDGRPPLGAGDGRIRPASSRAGRGGGPQRRRGRGRGAGRAPRARRDRGAGGA